MNELMEKSANNIVAMLLTDTTSYGDDVGSYIRRYLDTNPVALQFWADHFNIKAAGEDVSEIISSSLIGDLPAYKVFISKYASSHLIKNRTTLVYWLLWFAGFDSNEVVQVESFMSGLVGTVKPVVVACFERIS